MKISVIAVGNLREKFYQEACAEYLKRLKPMVSLEMVEIAEESLGGGESPALIRRALEREGEKILKRIGGRAAVVPLALEGRQLDSLAFAGELDPGKNLSREQLVFIIGSSHGLSPQVYQRADWRLSFGPMTFPHQLMRVILLEQIYRSFRIRAGEPYHK